jgi:hypothetical protein
MDRWHTVGLYDPIPSQSTVLSTFAYAGIFKSGRPHSGSRENRKPKCVEEDSNGDC